MFKTMDIGIDLGSTNTLIYIKGKGVVLHEPSVIAIHQKTNRLVAVGLEAQKMMGRTPPSIVVFSPIKDGVLSDFDMAFRITEHFINKVLKSKVFFKNVFRLSLSIPSGATKVERRAMRELGRSLGAKETYLVEEPIATSFNHQVTSGHLVLDIGGGVTDLSILSSHHRVLSRSFRRGGNAMNESIIRYIRQHYQTIISDQSAEEIKRMMGSAQRPTVQEWTSVVGRDLATGIPNALEISNIEVFESISHHLKHLVEEVKNLLEECPFNLSRDVMQNGIVLCGGGTLLSGLDALLERETGMPTSYASKALESVVTGCALSLEDTKLLTLLEEVSSF